MSCEEFSDAFDALVASYKYSPEYGNDFSSVDLTFDEYEKSVFLTKAQEEIVLSYYSGNHTDGFEQTEEIRRYLSPLNKTWSYTVNDTSTFIGYEKADFQIPSDVWFITFEVFNTSKYSKLVIPVNKDELFKTIQNPFKFNSDRYLRIEEGENESIIGKNLKGGTYMIYYLRAPYPIILSDLDEMSINGISSQSCCELHNSLHYKILDRAVALAIASKTIIQK